MKKILTLALALVALATGAMAQEKKIGKKTSKIQGYRYANEKYVARKYQKIAFYTDCKSEPEIEKIKTTFLNVGLRLELQKEDKFNPQTPVQRNESLATKGFDGLLIMNLTSNDVGFGNRTVGFEINFEDLQAKIPAVKYELKLYLGGFDKGADHPEKTYNRVCENILDDFRQYF